MTVEGQREWDAILVCPIARLNRLFFKRNLGPESNCPFGPQVANLDSIKGQEREDTVFRCMYRESSFGGDDKWNEAQGCKLSSDSPKATSYWLPAFSFSSRWRCSIGPCVSLKGHNFCKGCLQDTHMCPLFDVWKVFSDGCYKANGVWDLNKRQYETLKWTLWIIHQNESYYFFL